MRSVSLPLTYILSLLQGVGGVTLNHFPRYLADLMIVLNFELVIISLSDSFQVCSMGNIIC